MGERPALKRTLRIELELPAFYADDEPELIAEFGDPETPMGDQILRDLGDIGFAVLIVELSGEKDSDVVAIPVFATDARIVDEPPKPPEWMEEAQENLIERWCRENGWRQRS